MLVWSLPLGYKNMLYHKTCVACFSCVHSLLSTNHLFQGNTPSGPPQRPSKPQKTGIFLGNFLLTCECFGCRWRRRVLGCHKVTKSSTADLNWTWCAALLPGRPQSWVLFSFIVKQAKNSWQTPDYKAVLAKKKHLLSFLSQDMVK